MPIGLISVSASDLQTPTLLGSLLSRLDQQETEGFSGTLSVVVDNDRDASDAQLPPSLAQDARRRSVRRRVRTKHRPCKKQGGTESTGDFIALIDDDELPSARWLAHALQSDYVLRFRGVLGPVMPSFEVAPPDGLTGSLFRSTAHKNGHVVSWTETRTGNAMLRGRTVEPNGPGSIPRWERREDLDFFRRHIERGRFHVVQ